jgi:RNA polymerase sigma-70 factor (ECF subfamily)
MQSGDLEAVEAVLNGDVDAFAGIVERHQDDLHRYVRSRVSDFHEAQDVTARIFEEAFRSLASFRRERTNFRGWLFGIAGNLCIDWRRDRRNRNSSLIKLFGDLDSQPDSTDESETDPNKDDRSDDVRRAVARLPEKYREVLLLWGVSDLTVPEVARALGISEPTARKRLSRAREMLRLRLEPPAPPAAGSRPTRPKLEP